MSDLEMNKRTVYVKSIECGTSTTQIPETKIYKRRWLILAIFTIYSASNAMQWVQYTIISHIITRYYGVSEEAVSMTSKIYMITYIIFIVPGTWFIDRFGLRKAALVGSIGTALGSWIKVFSVAPDQYWVGFAGHTIVSISQTLILSVPSRLAAVWFGSDQVSSACSIGVFGNQLGVAIGFLFPPMLVPDGDNAVVRQGLQVMFYIVAALTSIIVVLILLFFKDKPSLPPSSAQVVQRDAEEENFFLSIKRLMTNRGYLLLLLSYAINVGVFYAISTDLNPVILSHYPSAGLDVGRIGLTIVLAGMLGSVVCGVLLDKTHRFKETTLGVYIFSFVGSMIFTFTLDVSGITLVYFSAGLLGFFMTGYLPVGFEFAAELTYPEPEGTSAGLLNAMTQIFGLIFTSLYEYLLRVSKDLWANVALCCLLGLGVIATAIIPNDLRRQNAKL